MKKLQVKAKKKTVHPLTLRERTIIRIRYCDGKTRSAIAKEIGRSKGTIICEIGGRPGRGSGSYDADRAHRATRDRIQRRGNVPKLEKDPKLREYAEEKLKLGWSPEQISIRLLLDHPRKKNMRISYEAVYRYVYKQIYRNGNGDMRPGCIDLRPYLSRRRKRRMKKGLRKARELERIRAFPSIETRPGIVEGRKRVGDWEDDTMVSRKSPIRIKSVSERKTGIVFFGKTENATAKACDEVVKKRLSGNRKGSELI